MAQSKSEIADFRMEHGDICMLPGGYPKIRAETENEATGPLGMGPERFRYFVRFKASGLAKLLKTWSPPNPVL